ncbi:MAG: DoxX family membrane protein [Acidobacteria bacterium]|nr:DoxX family membrane protein [Acidobacteriota bacterium]
MTVAVIDELFVRVRSTAFFLRFTLFTRILLAAGFIPTGLVKLLGQRFTTLPDTTPIGAFFESMYQTGLFWNFIGAVQVVAGVLLLTRRHAHLGALLFLPVIASINAINLALGFGLSTIITSLMLLAASYLCCWDYDRFRSLFTTGPFEPRHRIPTQTLDRWERLGFILFAISLLAFFGSTRDLVPGPVSRLAVPTGVAAGVFTLLRFSVVGRRRGREHPASSPGTRAAGRPGR